MRIGIDVDGCVRDLYTKLVQVYRRELDEDYHWCADPEKWGNYTVSNYFSLGDGIYDFWFKTHVEEIYTKSLAYEGLYEMEKLSEEGNDIIILTSQPNQATKIYTLEWILKHMPYVDEIHFTPDKGKVSCDIYLDDDPKHIENIFSSGGDVVVRDHKWNKGVYSDKRAASLEGFAMIVREMK